MIGALSGVVAAVGAEEAIIDVSGVGYVVHCGSRTLARLGGPGEAARVFVETHVREDQLKLYGFLSDEERAWFVRLQAIQGVGAKVALAILDAAPPASIVQAAAVEDAKTFQAAHGVGARLAQRIAGELKGKPGPIGRFGQAGAAPADAPANVVAAPVPADDPDLSVRADAVSALVNLGLDDAHARQAVASARAEFTDTPGLDDLVRAALRESAA